MGFHLQKFNNKEFVEGFYQKLYPLISPRLFVD